MINVYGIEQEVYFIEYEGLFRKKEIHTYGTAGEYPILAKSEEEAINKFKQTTPYKEAYTMSPIGWEFEHKNYNRIEVKVVSVNKFTFEYLKKKLSADDFMIYCKDRLGLYGTIKEIIN